MRRFKAPAKAAAMIRAHPRIAAAVAILPVIAALGVLVLAGREAPPPLDTGASVLPVPGPAPRPERTVRFEEGCMNARCHNDFSAAPFRHEPVGAGACGSCHEPDAGGHNYPLTRQGEEPCTSCHADEVRHTFTHRASDDGGCLACHDPHTSATRALLIEDSTYATCARCHPASEAPHAHPPYASGRCDDCHDPHGGEHPAFLFGGGGADHCARCHAPLIDEIQASPHAHKPSDADCLACHAPHTSEHESLLVRQPRDICVSCHEGVAAALAEATVSHDAVLQGHQCVSCHEPHASRNPKMLADRQPEVCLSCHDKPQRAADGRTIPEMATALASAPIVHGAIEGGDCSACHNVHGATHSRLLREINPTLLAGPYDIRNFALCFSCHSQDLLDSASATAFRDGDRNLHAAHLQSEGSPRSCASCHAVHTSDLPRLMARTVNFEGSGWEMPIGFYITDTGGGCAPACHEPMTYDRRPRPARGSESRGAP